MKDWFQNGQFTDEREIHVSAPLRVERLVAGEERRVRIPKDCPDCGADLEAQDALEEVNATYRYFLGRRAGDGGFITAWTKGSDADGFWVQGYVCHNCQEEVTGALTVPRRRGLRDGEEG